ncbi:MAG: thiosulfate oxidation carrier protein SoxY [Paracoccaceae bacterium]
MKLTRRDAITLGLGATAASFLPIRGMAAADAAIEDFTGGAEIGTGDFLLKVQEVARNSGEFQLTIRATGAAALIVIATGNPAPLVGRFDAALNGKPQITTRLIPVETQSVRVVAKMADGSFVQDATMVTVPERGYQS